MFKYLFGSLFSILLATVSCQQCPLLCLLSAQVEPSRRLCVPVEGPEPPQELAPRLARRANPGGQEIGRLAPLRQTLVGGGRAAAHVINVISFLQVPK